MILSKTRSWKSELQRLLDQEAVATMEVTAGEDCLQVRPADKVDGLTFGPYGDSPVKGLNFNADGDSAAS